MLRKDHTKRPDIEDIIFSDVFQAKAQTNGVTLPLMLNKSKLLQKYSTDKLDIELTDKQRKLAGLGPKGMEKSTEMNSKPNSLTQNFNKLNQGKAKREFTNTAKLKPSQIVKQSERGPKELKPSNTMTSLGKPDSSNADKQRSRLVSGR